MSEQRTVMDKETIKAKLKAHEVELRAAGIVHLHLHGSVVRGEAQAGSDVDLAAVFDRSKVRTALNEVRLRNWISDLLHADVDLANRERLKEDIVGNFDREAELVF
jgi:uncharacterized protein